MKEKILISLILLTVFCAAPIFAQEKLDLVTEIIKFNNIKIPSDKKEIFLSAFLRPLLSKNGSIEFHVKGQKIIFTDTRNRIKLIKGFTEIMDDSGFQLDDFFAKSGKGKKLVTEFVEIHYIYPMLWCDVGEELILAKFAIQERLLTKMLEEIKVKSESGMIDYSSGVLNPSRGLNLMGTKKRVGLGRKFVALFDQPILIEDSDF